MSAKSEPTHLNVWMSSVEDFLAKTSAVLALDVVSAAPSPASGTSSPESSPSSDLDSSSSKTSRAARSSGSQRSKKTSQLSDTEPVPTRFLPMTSGLPISEGESLSWLLPTPTASSYGSNQGGANGRTGAVRLSLQAMAAKGLLATPTEIASQLSPSMAKWPGCAAWQMVHPTGPLLPSFVEFLMGFPDGWTDCGPSATRSSRSARKSSAASSSKC